MDKPLWCSGLEWLTAHPEITCSISAYILEISLGTRGLKRRPPSLVNTTDMRSKEIL